MSVPKCVSQIVKILFVLLRLGAIARVPGYVYGAYQIRFEFVAIFWDFPIELSYNAN